jgi:hypothetical protein
MDKATAKQKAIKNAWVELVGESGFLQLRLDEEGYSDWRCRKVVPSKDWDKLHDRFKRGSSMKSGSDLIYRPKTLRNLSDNNGWIRIEPDGSNLPEPNTDVYYRMHPWGNPATVAMSGKGIHFVFHDGRCTHYKPIEEQLLPIY